MRDAPGKSTGKISNNRCLQTSLDLLITRWLISPVSKKKSTNPTKSASICCSKFYQWICREHPSSFPRISLPGSLGYVVQPRRKGTEGSAITCDCASNLCLRQFSNMGDCRYAAFYWLVTAHRGRASGG